MKKSEAKRAAASPKKVKSESRLITQDELIARALDNEEGNIVEHRDYLMLEEEKRKRARVVRAAVHGPLLRWVSRTEEVTMKVEPATTAAYPYAYGGVPSYNVSGGSLFPMSGAYHPTNVPYYASQTRLPGDSIPAPHLPAKSPAQPPLSSSHEPAPTQAPTPIPEQISTRTEKVANNYVIHELGQFETVQKPPWNETMRAMFGDHPWDDMRVFVGRSRPLARPKQICPITGRPARYLDPRTGVPYADLNAFRTLTRILSYEYAWSDALGCYVAREGEDSARGVRAMGQANDAQAGGGDVSMDVT